MKFRETKSGLFVPDRKIIRRCNGLLHARPMAGGGGGVHEYNHVRLYVLNNRAGGTSGQNYCYDVQLSDVNLTNILVGGIATASSVYSIQTADKAFDGNYTTYHANNPGDYPYYIQYQTVNPVTPLIMSMRCSNMGAWEIRASNDASFSTYTVLASENAGNWNTENFINYPFYYGLKDVEVWDINITSAGSTGTSTQALLKGFEIRGSGGTNLLSGGYPIYSSTNNSYTQVTNMLSSFNGATQWSNVTTNGDTIANGKVRFGYILPPGVSIVSSAVTLAIASVFNSGCPRAFTLRRKNIGSTTFNLLNSYTTVWPDNTPQTFTI